MTEWGGFLSKGSGFSEGRTMRNEEFDEEDVWGMAKESEYSSPKTRVSKESSGSSSAWPLSTSPRKIPMGNKSMTLIPSSESNANVVQGSSEPVDIPDMSNIYGDKLGGCGNGVHYHDHDYGDDEEDDMIPPHEWIARKLARSQISSFSVCEGIGRTLKGRDLSKVRNAILTKTGFIE
ncbi:putative senescence regulator S40 [Lupinus albus]|uniref:Putative senescence regulator S40 n=1 Tax=Lupinus albus TaxID=3870 RepID=A0A6A4Q6T4_LUPAL|nr:putative senescence regulator S40 [Lupinus albus]